MILSAFNSTINNLIDSRKEQINDLVSQGKRKTPDVEIDALNLLIPTSDIL
jgi:hypothetical protein